MLFLHFHLYYTNTLIETKKCAGINISLMPAQSKFIQTFYLITAIP